MPDEPALPSLSFVDAPSLERLFRRFIERAPASRPAPSPTPISREQIESAVVTFARALTWQLRISGKHYSGMSNADLFAVLRAQGRDFAADTRSLRDHVRTALVQAFVADGEALTSPSARQYAADAILEWIVMRFERGGMDVPLRPLTRAYAAFKRRRGLDHRVGIANGDLLDAVREGDVVVAGDVPEAGESRT